MRCTLPLLVTERLYLRCSLLLRVTERFYLRCSLHVDVTECSCQLCTLGPKSQDMLVAQSPVYHGAVDVEVSALLDGLVIRLVAENLGLRLGEL